MPQYEKTAGDSTNKKPKPIEGLLSLGLTCGLGEFLGHQMIKPKNIIERIIF